MPELQHREMENHVEKQRQHVGSSPQQQQQNHQQQQQPVLKQQQQQQQRQRHEQQQEEEGLLQHRKKQQHMLQEGSSSSSGSPSPPPQEQQRNEAQLLSHRIFDRQIRLWGVEAQKRLLSARLLVVGLTSINVELVKNMTLAGVQATLCDDREVSDEDFTFNFLLDHSSSLHQKKTVAAASLAALQEMAPLRQCDCLSQFIFSAAAEQAAAAAREGGGGKSYAAATAPAPTTATPATTTAAATTTTTTAGAAMTAAAARGKGGLTHREESAHREAAGTTAPGSTTMKGAPARVAATESPRGGGEEEKEEEEEKGKEKDGVATEKPLEDLLRGYSAVCVAAEFYSSSVLMAVDAVCRKFNIVPGSDTYHVAPPPSSSSSQQQQQQQSTAAAAAERLSPPKKRQAVVKEPSGGGAGAAAGAAAGEDDGWEKEGIGVCSEEDEEEEIIETSSFATEEKRRKSNAGNVARLAEIDTDGIEEVDGLEEVDAIEEVIDLPTKASVNEKLCAKAETKREGVGVIIRKGSPAAAAAATAAAEDMGCSSYASAYKYKIYPSLLDAFTYKLGDADRRVDRGLLAYVALLRWLGQEYNFKNRMGLSTPRYHFEEQDFVFRDFAEKLLSERGSEDAEERNGTAARGMKRSRTGSGTSSNARWPAASATAAPSGNLLLPCMSVMAGCQYTPTAAVIGGLLAQELRKYITGEQEPIPNCIVFDFDSSTASTAMLPPTPPAAPSAASAALIPASKDNVNPAAVALNGSAVAASVASTAAAVSTSIGAPVAIVI